MARKVMALPPRFAIVTPSFRGDAERCRLLCASIDRFVSGLATHYLLVEDRDVASFKDLIGPKRRVIAESELFPRWMTSWPDPFTAGKRRIWTGAGAIARGLKPLRGWHAQQLRKLALPGLVPEEILMYADSDAIFLRPYDLAQQMIEGRARLYCKPLGITQSMPEHVSWAEHTLAILGLPGPTFPMDDYINNLATWTAANVVALRAHLEAVSGRDWISAVASARSFSEMMIYGTFVDQIATAPGGHFKTDTELSRTYWLQEDVEGQAFAQPSQLMRPEHVSVGVQSFINVPMAELWNLFRRAAADPA